MIYNVSVGVEFLVNKTTVGNQANPSTTMLAGGGFVVVWEDHSDPNFDPDVRGQIFDAEGNKVGSELRIHPKRVGHQGESEVIALAGGGFAVAWFDTSGIADDLSGWAVKLRIFNAQGVPSGPDFTANLTTNFDQGYPRMSVLGNGNFAVVWQDTSGEAGFDWDIRGSIFNPQGVRIGGEFIASHMIGDRQYEPDIATIGDNRFLVVWSSIAGAQAQIVNNAGALIGAPIQVSPGDRPAYNVAVASLSGNRNVVVWEDTFPGSSQSNGIWAQILDDAGRKVGSPISITTTEGWTLNPSVSALSDGGFVVVWSDTLFTLSGDAQYDIVGRAYSSEGHLTHNTFIINSSTDGSQVVPKVEPLSNGRLLVTWRDLHPSGQDPSGSAVRAQIVDLDGAQFRPEQITIASLGMGNEPGNSDSFGGNNFQGGNHYGFTSLSTNLHSPDSNGAYDAFIRDQVSGAIEIVSISSEGVQGNADSWFLNASVDGRFVVFVSAADNLVENDGNGAIDIFLRDRLTNTTKLVSLSSEEIQANGASRNAALSANGRFVVFESNADNLVSGDSNGSWDIFSRDLITGTTTRVSVGNDEGQGDNSSHGAQQSADGRFVAFWSYADNLTATYPSSNIDSFIRDTLSGTTLQISVGFDGSTGNADSYVESITADGRFVGLTSWASNLVSSDVNAQGDVFVRSITSGRNSLVSVSTDGTQGNGTSGGIRLSADGRYATFTSWASNLVENDTNGTSDIFVRDLITGRTARVSINRDGTEGNGESYNAHLSPDGSAITFTSLASNLVSGDINGGWDVFTVANPLFGAPVKEFEPWNFSSLAQPDVLTFALLANDSYRGDEHSGEDGLPPNTTLLPPPGWEILLTTYDGSGGWPKNADGLNLPVYSTADTPGMQATAYREIATGRVVIGYRGTDVGGPENELFATSFALGLGLQDFELIGLASRAESYLIKGMAFYREVIDVIGADPIEAAKSVSFTGHSLGGMVAGYMAAITGREGMLFDSGPHTEILESLDSRMVRHPGYGFLPDGQSSFDRVYHTRVNGEILGAAVDVASNSLATVASIRAFLELPMTIFYVLGAAVNPLATLSVAAVDALVQAIAERWGDADVLANKLPELLASPDGLIDGLAAGLNPNLLHSMPLLGVLLYAHQQPGLVNLISTPDLFPALFSGEVAASVNNLSSQGLASNDLLAALLRSIYVNSDLTPNHDNPLKASLFDALTMIKPWSDASLISVSFGADLVGSVTGLSGRLSDDEVLKGMAQIITEAGYRAATSSGSLDYQLDTFTNANGWIQFALQGLGGGTWAGLDWIRKAIAKTVAGELMLGSSYRVMDQVLISADTTTGSAGIGSTGRDLMIGALQAGGLGVNMSGMGGNDLLFGTRGGDTLNGGNGANLLIGGSGEDSLTGGANKDTMLGGNDRDSILGAQSDDLIFGGDGVDTLRGDAGNDILKGGRNGDSIFGGVDSDIIYGQAGADTMYGGDGDDSFHLSGNDFTRGEIISGDTGWDKIVTTGIVSLRQTATIAGIEELMFLPGAGTGSAKIQVFSSQISDAVQAGDLPQNLRLTDGGNAQSTFFVQLDDGYFSGAQFTFSNWGTDDRVHVQGTSTEDRIFGSIRDDRLDGLQAADVLHGLDGDDTLDGGYGSDVLHGGAGMDTFIYRDHIASGVGVNRRDKILDFVSGEDVIDLSNLDANFSELGRQAFAWGGTLKAASSVWYEVSGADLILKADLISGSAADFEILIVGRQTLSASDFLL